MGNNFDKYYKNPSGTPYGDSAPTFDPEFGFANGRKPRVMLATKEEMDSAKLKADERDYCAHVLLRLLSCKSEHWPWMVKCHHERHAYQTCEFEDYVLRMKEFEREKRLLRRQQRLEQAAA